MSGKYHTPEFIDKVRQLAASGMSASDAAAEMSTKKRPITRSAMLGISHREKFKFGGPKNRGGRVPGKVYPRKAQTRIVPQRAVCSWHECNRSVEEGDMFCAGHNRKGLM